METNKILRVVHFFGLKPASKGWYRGNCPICNYAPYIFGISTIGRCNCFVCGYKGSLKSLLIDSNAFDEEGAKKFLNTGSDDDLIAPYTPNTPKEDIIKEELIELPQGYKILSQKGTSTMNDRILSYMEKRGFSFDFLRRKFVGYTQEDPNFKGYIILPYLNFGRLTYFTARNFNSNGPKYKNPAISKSRTTFNEEALVLYNRVRIVESVMNGYTIGESAMGLGGKFLGRYHIELIKKSPCNTLVWFLDGDAYLESLKNALEFSNYKRQKVIKMPKELVKGEWKWLDVNDIGKSESIKLEKKSEFLSYTDLKKLIQQETYEKALNPLL